MSQQNPLTLVTPILPERHQDLYVYLRQIKEELESGQHEQFEDIGTIHFARWVVIDDATVTGNPTHEKMAKLVFTSNFDGPVDQHIYDLCTKASDVIDRIYSSCIDYPAEKDRTPENRVAYIKKWVVKTTSFYKGAPGRTMKQIRDELDLRNFMKSFIDSNHWENKTAQEVHKSLQQAVYAKPEFKWAQDPVSMPQINWLGTIVMGLIIVACLPLLIPGIILLHVFYERKDKNFTLKRSQLDEAHIRVLEEYEDLHFQNQFTQLVSMKKGKVRLFAFQAMMLLGSALIQNIFVKGKLMGIPTIHFARWVLFDQNKRVLFFSNFDGSWQQYLGDFIDQSGWGLTGIFSNTENFPKTDFLLTGGAYNEEHFLAWSRYTQLPTQIWYNAYPDISIKNVNNNTRLRSLLCQSLSDKQAQAFLKLI